MRHAAPSKNHHRFQRHPLVTRPVRRQPMATPVKKDRTFSLSFGGVGSLFKNIFLYLRGHVYLFIGLILLTVLSFLVFGTQLFQIQTITYTFSDLSEDCVSKATIHEEYFKHPPLVLSHFFMDGSRLRNKYPCLDTLTFGWNPFSFNTLAVYVYAEKPVAMFTVRGGVEGDQIRYVTREGDFITLVASPSLPSFLYILQPEQKLASVHIDPKDLQTVLTLRKYMLDEFNSDAVPELFADGTVRVFAPFAEQIYITLHDDLSVQLGSLQAILGMATIDKKKIQTIDLRFGNPVIKFRQ